MHNLFTIAGRTDAPGCNLQQPDFAAQLAANNVIFRIPTPLFGLGLVEDTPDYVLKQNLASTAGKRQALGIGGMFNLSGNDGTIMKFGWKAQNKSLTVFAGEAYNVEMGITNDIMPNERNLAPGCAFNPTPEDSHSQAGGSDVDAFVDAMRMSAPATPVTPTPSTSNGASLFSSIGCALCHSPSLTTGASPNTGMSGVTYNPYSDFALHHMGPGLADGINQGAAGPDQFRTAPLWGVGQRLFFLHDGRTSDLLQAIKDHGGDDCWSWNDHDRNHRPDQRNCGSEADGVIHNFKTLSPTQVQDLLNFLRSL